MAMDQDKKDRNEMVNENYALVGTNIACLRQIYGEDQAALAEAIGVGETAISNYEKRKRTPQRNELFLIAEHYQVAMQMPLKIVWMMNGVQWRVYWQIMQKSWHLRKDIIQTIFLLMTITKSRLIYNDKFQQVEQLGK